MATKVEPAELITSADVARLLEVSPQRAHQLAQQARFPRAIGRVGNSDVWRASDVDRWRVQRTKEQWMAEAVALAPRTGGFLQSQFRALLQAGLANALGTKPSMPGASVADVVRAALDSVSDLGVPRFDPALLKLDWPAAATGGSTAEKVRVQTEQEARYWKAFMLWRLGEFNPDLRDEEPNPSHRTYSVDLTRAGRIRAEITEVLTGAGLTPVARHSKAGLE